MSDTIENITKEFNIIHADILNNWWNYTAGCNPLIYITMCMIIEMIIHKKNNDRQIIEPMVTTNLMEYRENMIKIISILNKHNYVLSYSYGTSPKSSYIHTLDINLFIKS